MNGIEEARCFCLFQYPFASRGGCQYPFVSMKTIRLLILLGLLVIPARSHALVFERDQRLNVEDSKDPRILDLAKSVFTFIPKSKLVRLLDGSYEFVDQVLLKDRVDLCVGERYADDVSVGTRCSGFLAAPALGVTAGHCVSPTQVPDFCANYYIVFDYFSQARKLSSQSVYECSGIPKLVFSENGSSDDYAVLQFSQAVLNRAPLTLRTQGKIQDGESIFMLGHPRGMSQKISAGRTVVRNSDPSFFSTNLDCFRGNSGSPVFNSTTHLVEGIFVQGNGFVPNHSSDPRLIGDFYADSTRRCNRTLICKEAEGCTAVMDATRATRIQLQ